MNDKYYGLLSKNDYIELFDALANNFLYLNNKEKELLSDLLLFCGIDFVVTKYKPEIQNNANIYFSRNNRLHNIKAILDADINMFYYVYNNINNTSFISNKLKEYAFFKDIHLPKINLPAKKNRSYDDMNANGIYVEKNFFDKDFISELKNFTLEYMETNKNSKEFYDFKHEGRKRIFIRQNNYNEILQKLVNNEYINNVINNLYANNCSYELQIPHAIQLEHLYTPEIPTDWQFWHFDNLSDQIKVFIPLENIDEDCGPLHFIDGTHKFEEYPNFRELAHYIFGQSSIFTNMCNGFPTIGGGSGVMFGNFNVKKALANIGDLVFFNPSFAHSGSTCKNGKERLNIVLIYSHASIRTNKNILFSTLQPLYSAYTDKA